MNRQLRRLTVAQVALSLALVGPAAVHAEESPFPASGWYPVVSPQPGASNYSGRFDSASGYAASGKAAPGQAVNAAGQIAYVGLRLFPFGLVLLPVAGAVLVVGGIGELIAAAAQD
jgi:hypothetical protein